MTVTDLRSGKETTISENDKIICAIGNFDGVHIGHKELLDRVCAESDKYTKRAVWTFKEHPYICRNGYGAKILTSLDEKAELFRKNGIDIMITEDFSSVSNMPYDKFASDILYKKCGIRAIVCGYNFKFGKDAKGNAASLSDIFSKLGARTIIIPKKTIDGIDISSTKIRELVSSGDIETANRLLGRPFSISLPVVNGNHIGRTIDFPTMNMTFNNNSEIPRNGVYACKCKIDGKYYNAIANIGTRPTVSNTGNVNCETHIIGYSGDLYGKTITVEFYKFLRSEVKFKDLPSLKAQISIDKISAEKYLKGDKKI